MQLTANLEENRSKLYEIFPISTSYDLISRDLYLGKTKAFWLGINGFCKNDLYVFLYDVMLLSINIRDDRRAAVYFYKLSEIEYA